LAVTVYEMLCGRRPFEDGTKTKVLVLHTSKAPPRLTQWCPALPERLSQTVLKGLSKDPNQRYPRCVDLAKAVAAAAGGAVARDDRVRLIGGSGGHTTPQGSQSARGGTMVLSAAGNQGERAALTDNKPQAARPGSGTLIERAAPHSDEAPVTGVFKSLASAEPERLKPPEQRQPAADGNGSANQTQLWIPVGAGALALLFMVTFIISQFAPRQETIPSAAAPSQAPVVPPAQATQSNPPVPSPAGKPLTKTTELATATGPRPKPTVQPTAGENRAPDAPLTSGGELAKTKREATEKDDLRAPLAKNLNAAVNRKKVEPATTAFADGRFDLALLEKKPSRDRVTLEKLLSAPRSYSNQIVIPTGMYNLAPSRSDRSDGLRKWLATERKIGSKKDTSALELTLSPSRDLELEPNLAAHLDGLEADKWKDKMAILTVWITKDGSCGLVKAEILEKATPIIRKVGYTHKGFIEYETLIVTPEGPKVARGNDELWEQVGRMSSFANHYRNQVKAYRRMLLANEQIQLSAQMNTMFDDMMRNAAAQELQLRQLQRAIGGR